MQWVSTLQTADDFSDAVADAIAALAARLVAAPDLVFAFVSPAGRAGLGALGRALRGHWPQARVVGCTGGGALADGREVEGVAAVALVGAVLPGVTLQPFYLEAEGLPDRAAAPAAWAEAVGWVGAPPAGVIVLPDPFSFRPEPLLRGLNLAFPGVPVVGGVASGGARPGDHGLFLDDSVYSRGAVGVCLGGAVQVQAVVAQGCRPVGQPMFVTAAERHILRQLDGRPATDQAQAVFEGLSAPEQALARRALFLGLVMQPAQQRYQAGDFLVRGLVGADPELGALVVAAELRPNQVVQFHVRDADTSRHDLDALLAAHAEAATTPAAGALMFACLGRGEGLYGAPGYDSEAVRAHLGADLPLAGFFCNGEIGPVGDQAYVHGFTSVIAVFRPLE